MSSFPSFFTVRLIIWTVDFSNGSICLFFFKYLWVDFVRQKIFFIYIVEFDVYREQVSNWIVMIEGIEYFVKLTKGRYSFLFFDTTVWKRLCHSLSISVVFIHFNDFWRKTLKLFLTVFIFYFNEYSFSKMSVSKASLVLTQLNPPINVVSKTLTNSASVGRAIEHLLFIQWTHSEKRLALLHFLDCI